MAPVTAAQLKVAPLVLILATDKLVGAGQDEVVEKVEATKALVSPEHKVSTCQS